MLRTIALLLVFALLAAASEAVLRPTEAGQVEVANRLRTSPKRLLRAASTIIDDEERAIIPVGEQTLLKFSKIVGKKGMQTLAKRLEGKAWEVGKKADHKAWLKAGASPSRNSWNTSGRTRLMKNCCKTRIIFATWDSTSCG